MTLKQLVDQYTLHHNAFHVKELVDLFTDDCVFQNMTNTAGVVECQGKAELTSMTEQSKGFFKTRHQAIKNWIIGENSIAIETEFTGVLACDLENGFKTGDTLTIQGVSIFEFENGKIKRLTDYS